DTVAFTPHDIGIGFGVPSGASKHLTERLTLAADGLQLRYELTVEDPEYLAAPATYTAMWDHRPDLGFSDTACDPQNSERSREGAASARWRRCRRPGATARPDSAAR